MPVEGEVFYLVTNNPPSAEDMKSAKESGRFEGMDDCLRAALSCARQARDLTFLQENVPRFRRSFIAKATLRQEHGVIKQTGKPTHYSLWLRRRFHATVQTLFTVVPNAS